MNAKAFFYLNFLRTIIELFANSCYYIRVVKNKQEEFNYETSYIRKSAKRCLH